MLKNLKQFNEQKLNFEEYAKAPCQITRALKDNICYYVPTLRDSFGLKITQPDELDSVIEGIGLYTTFVEYKGKHYHIGLFPNCGEITYEKALSMVGIIKGNNEQ